MRVAVIRGGTVENVIEAASVEGAASLFPDATCLEAGDAGPGWTYADGVFTPPEPEPPPVVLSVLPVAFRRALRNTPAPAGPEVFALAEVAAHALEYVIAALNQPGYEEPKDAFEYMVRAERGDLVALGGALGFTTAQIDGVLALAATYPGSDAVYGPAP